MSDKTELCKFAKKIVESEYGINVEHVRQLPSYLDLNFHILPGKQNKQSRSILVDGYVLKIFNTNDSKQTGELIPLFNLTYYSIPVFMIFFCLF